MTSSSSEEQCDLRACGEFFLSENDKRVVGWSAYDNYLRLTFSPVDYEMGCVNKYMHNASILMKLDPVTGLVKEIIMKFEDIARFPYYHRHDFDEEIGGLIVYMRDRSDTIEDSNCMTVSDDDVRIIVDFLNDEPVCLDVADVKTTLCFS